jgi:hypothetical protein
MRLRAARFPGLLLGSVVLLAACTTTTVQAPPAAVGPSMVIERFLRAANQNDLDTMGSLFGTRDGPISRSWSRRELDERMFLLASLLRHTDYNVGSEQIVPGRREEATQYTVQLALAQGPVQVPFTLVRTRRSEWLIEQIGIERITHPGRRP